MSVMEELKKEQSIPVIIADHNGTVIYINSKFEEVFLWAKDEILNKHITVIIPEDLHDAHNLGFSRFLSTEQSTILGQPIELAAVKKNGAQFNAEHIIFSEKTNDSWVFGATIRPLNEVAS